MKILSIDAWRDGEGNWEWNNWHHIANIAKDDFEAISTSNRRLLKWFRDAGILTNFSMVGWPLRMMGTM